MLSNLIFYCVASVLLSVGIHIIGRLERLSQEIAILV